MQYGEAMSKAVEQTSQDDEHLRPLLRSLRGLIQQARQQVLRAVDVVQLQTSWEIGRHIVEFEQNGSARAEYGKRLLPALATALTTEFCKGFDATNLWHMRRFFLAFPILDAVRRELSWTHYRTLLRVENDQARQWYMNEAANQNWSTVPWSGSSALSIMNGSSPAPTVRRSNKKPWPISLRCNGPHASLYAIR